MYRFCIVIPVHVVVFGHGGGAITPTPEELARGPQITSAVLFAETLENGEQIVGARLEYPGEVAAIDIKFLSTYSVPGFRIIGSFVNNDGVWNHAEVQGRYVFLRFATDIFPGPEANVTQYRLGAINIFWPLDVVIRQRGAIKLMDGSLVQPSGIVAREKVNNITDACLDLAFVDSTGFKVKYRLFVPKGYEARKDELKNLPLVIFWHGGSSSGHDNELQMTTDPSAVEFIKPEAQAKHPCFVMVPQSVNTINPGDGVWARNNGTKETPNFGPTESLSASIEALRDVMGTYNIDDRRVYGTGLSQGSRAVWTTSILNPDLFAAQLNVCSADIYSDDEIRPLVGKPVWALVSVNDRPDRVAQSDGVIDQAERLGAKVNRKVGNDGFNGFLRGYDANLLAKAQWDEAKAQGATMMITHFIAGTVLPDPHECWVFTFNNEVIRDWLFEQSK